MLHISVLMSPVGGYWNRCNFTAALRRARVNPPHRKSFSQTCFRISAWLGFAACWNAKPYLQACAS